MRSAGSSTLVFISSIFHSIHGIALTIETEEFFQFKIIINVIIKVDSFRFICIPMLSGYGSTASIYFLIFPVRQILTSVDV